MAMFEVDEQVLENVKRSFTVPSRPELLLELQNHLNSKDPNINHVADIVSKDVGIAAGVLKLVNSAAFGLSRSVSDIRHSAMFIGLNGIYSIVTALVLKQSFNGNTSSISLENFWDRAAIVAEVAVQISGRFKGVLSQEEVYTAALFQDCGIPAMALKYQDYHGVLSQAEYDTQFNLAELEEHTYKTNHAVVGYFISSTWQLPRHICQQVLLHHDKTFFEQTHETAEKLLFAVIKMAENIVHQHHCCNDLADWYWLKESIFDLFEIDDDDYLDIIDDVEHFFNA